MKKLIVDNKEFKAERIVKTVDSIIGYTAAEMVFVFRGVSDFSGFTLGEGQEFDVPALTDKERIAEIENIINDLLLGGLLQ